jgi:uracil-DNA glycosylase
MKTLEDIHKKLAACRACPKVCGTPVHGLANYADVLLVGQAPGPHEAKLGKPFAYTAGKTLFNWLSEVSGLGEEELREKIYFAAVARCFPGKNPHGGGDREPDEKEIKRCREFLAAEVEVLKPKLILAVGKLAIREVLGPKIFTKTSKLSEVIGKKFYVNFHGQHVHVIPLPHPSGISSWHKTEPGMSLLRKGLELIRPHLKPD